MGTITVEEVRMVRKEIARLVASRLLEYYRYMLCKPDKEAVKSVKPPAHVRLDLSSLHPISVPMLYGFQLERSMVTDYLVGTPLKKPVKVSDFEEVLAWLFLDQVVVPVPSMLYKEFFNCDLDKNVVFEFWMPRIDQRLLERAVKSVVTLAIPQDTYILSYKEMISSLKTIIGNGSEIRLYVLSKFAQPGYLGKFIEEFGGSGDITVYIATEEPSIPSYFKKKLETYGNVFIVPTRSHRKLVLAVFRDEFGDWSLTGYRGSMNLFYPGVDDYMEAVNDLKDLQRLIHGLIRAFLVT